MGFPALCNKPSRCLSQVCVYVLIVVLRHLSVRRLWTASRPCSLVLRVGCRWQRPSAVSSTYPESRYVKHTFRPSWGLWPCVEDSCLCAGAALLPDVSTWNYKEWVRGLCGESHSGTEADWIGPPECVSFPPHLHHTNLMPDNHHHCNHHHRHHHHHNHHHNHQTGRDVEEVMFQMIWVVTHLSADAWKGSSHQTPLLPSRDSQSTVCKLTSFLSGLPPPQPQEEFYFHNEILQPCVVGTQQQVHKPPMELAPDLLSDGGIGMSIQAM